MNIKSSEKKEKSMVELIVEVSAEEFDSAINDAFKKNRNSISVPGFRKGKAPRKIIERMYGATIFHSDALDIILPSVLSFAATESKLNLIGYPDVSDVDINEGGGGIDVTINIAEYPAVKIGEYKGLSAVKPAAEVPESLIDSEIAGIRLRNARFEKAERPALNGDVAVIDYEGFVDGETFEGGSAVDYELELGSNSFIPGFEEKIQGMTVDEERDLDLVFPENYTEELAGKSVVFKVRLKELREKILPDIDDEFAKDVSEFDTMDEYKASIKEKFMNARQEDADAAFENALMSKIIETMVADIPDVMVEEQLDNAMNNFAQQISAYGMDPASYLQMTNTTPEAFRETMRTSSEKQVKMMLALEKIAELEGISISDEDIENEYKEAAERYSMELEKFKESVNDEAISRDIKFKRAAKIVTDSAIAEDPPLDEEPPTDEELPVTEEDTAAEETPSEAKPRKKTGAQTGDESRETDEPASEAEKPKKPAAKKTVAKKTAPDVKDTVSAETGHADEKNHDAAPADAEKVTDRPAKKTAAKEPKPKAVSSSPDDAPQPDSEPVKKTASKKAKTTNEKEPDPE